MNKSQAQLQNQSGFTLVEAMVAITILSMAVTGPLLIAQKGIGSAIYARDQITASYLAQEAVEFVRNVRDSNRIYLPPGESWLYQFDGCMEDGSGRKCRIDSQYADFLTVGAIETCPAGDECPVLMLDSDNDIYGYGSGGSWKPAIFTRTISIDETVTNREALVTVTISWQTKLFNPVKSFTVREYIFNF